MNEEKRKNDCVEFLNWVWVNSYSDNNHAEDLYKTFLEEQTKPSTTTYLTDFKKDVMNKEKKESKGSAFWGLVSLAIAGYIIYTIVTLAV